MKQIMECRIKNKRGEASTAIGILVMMTLFVSISALYYFNLKDNDINQEIDAADFLDSIYVKQSLIEFYVQGIVDRAAKGVNTDEEFVNNFKTNLDYYKLEGDLVIGELSQFETKIDSSEIIIEDGEVSVEFEIELGSSLKEFDGGEIASAINIYKKEFVGKV